MPIQIIPYHPNLSCHPARPFSLRQEELAVVVAAVAAAVVVAVEASCQARQRQEAKGEPADQVQP